jgi:1-acyl-sn-glycerol-3-phosphate acyltransferase
MLPLILLPPTILMKLRIISRLRREHLSLRAGQFCSRWLMRLIPFAKIKVINPSGKPVTEPTVWVCNHMSMLDVFFLLAAKKKLVARPIKIVYWKGLESNPVTKALFTACGFIPVGMADNGHGSANEYDRSSFKSLLRGTKQSFEEGFDLGILPEGQLNPHPENGLSPIFSGAFTLAKRSKRPIRMMALHGTNHLWHPHEERGMKCAGRTVSIRMYPEPLQFDDATHFSETFTKVVGHFGAKGEDMPEDELQQIFDAARLDPVASS